jgi:hypothetical protein
MMDPTKEQNHILCNGDPGSNYQTSVQGRKHEPYTGVSIACSVPIETTTGNVKSVLVICFDIKGIIHKEFVLAGQTVNSAYYC